MTARATYTRPDIEADATVTVPFGASWSRSCMKPIISSAGFRDGPTRSSTHLVLRLDALQQELGVSGITLSNGLALIVFRTPYLAWQMRRVFFSFSLLFPNVHSARHRHRHRHRPAGVALAVPPPVSRFCWCGESSLLHPELVTTHGDSGVPCLMSKLLSPSAAAQGTCTCTCTPS